MRLAQIFIICLVLTTISLGLFAYKAFYLHFPLMPNENAQSWVVEAQLRFQPDWGKPLRVSFFTPQGTSNLAKVNDNIIASNYGIEHRVGKETGNQRILLTRRQAHGRQMVFYRATFYELKSSDQAVTTAASSDKAPEASSPFLLRKADDAANGDLEPAQMAMASLIDEAQQKSADVPSFVTEVIKLLKQSAMPGGDDRVTVLQTSMESYTTLPELVNIVINTANIPARIVNGVELKEKQHSLPLIQWIEFYNQDHWESADIQTGKLGLNKNYLPWWRGDQNLFELSGGHDMTIEMSAKYNREDAIVQAMWKSKDASKLITNLSLLELPIDTQLMFNIVLMIPIGALVIVLLRQLIGIPTFGTFMPVLMALSFRETGLFWGIGLFTLIVMIGLFLRAYFDELRLLVVPRLAAVLTIVVMLIAALTVISYRFGINAGLSVTLFPMIILTMTIERMALTTEEFGAKTARRTAYGSVIAASLAYFAMHNSIVEHLIFLFPELLLIPLACFILLGRYNGYKLSEYFRFKKLAKAMQDNAMPTLPAE
jgi:hypothetical protein